MTTSENIQVAIRMRPLIERELKDDKLTTYWKVQDTTIYESPSTSYQFDRVFQGSENNKNVYEELCSPIVKSVIDGFNGTIFAYGQTSSGKTFTLMGNDKNMGIIHYTIQNVFELIRERPERDFIICVSYMEIYNEAIRDLLSNDKDSGDKLKLTEEMGQIKVNGLKIITVRDPKQLLNLLKKGNKNKKMGETEMNKESSRSHSIFQVIIESCLRDVEDATATVSLFNLVDLAGSERANQTKAKGQRFKESIHINKSLLVLGQVINQLSENHSFINYRDSKITRILQNSLGGNAKTAIICTVTSASREETLSTLKFATRAKCIKNKPHVNEAEETKLKQLQNLIRKLTKENEEMKKEKNKSKESFDNFQQIINLQQQFVSQAPEVPRANRRETWGGSQDAAKFRKLSAQRLSSEEDLFKSSRKSELSECSVFSDDYNILESTRFSKRSCLPSVQEESEVENEYPEVSSCSSFQPSYRENISSNLVKDNSVQTDIELFVDSEKEKNMKETICSLQKRIKELNEFTTYEKEIFGSSYPISTDNSNVYCEENKASALKTITELKNTSELKEKQIELLRDEVTIQKQMIETLKQEISLKNEPVNVFNNACQTSFINSNGEDEEIEILKEEIKVQEQIIEHLQQERSMLDGACQTSVIENITSEDIEKFDVVSENKILTSESEMQTSFDYCSPSMTEDTHDREKLSSLINNLGSIGSFTLQKMKKHMSATFWSDICEPERVDSLEDNAELNVKFVKKLLLRLESYVRNVQDSANYFQSLLETKMCEVSMMQRKLDETQQDSDDKVKEHTLLEASVSDLQNKFAALLAKFEIPMYPTEKKFVTVLKESKLQQHISCLKKMGDTLDSFLEKNASKNDSLSRKLVDVEMELKSVNSKLGVYKLSRYIQTEEDPLIIDLEGKIQELRSQVSVADENKEALECKIKHLKQSFEKEKETWMYKTEECVKLVEEKCDQLLTNQENKHHDELYELLQNQLKQREEDLNEYKTQLSNQMLKFNADVEDLNEKHKIELGNANKLHSKLKEESIIEKSKLHENIKSLNKKITKLELQNIEMRNKGNILLGKLRQQCLKQDASSQTELEMASIIRKSIGLQTHTTEFLQEVPSNFCSNCRSKASEILGTNKCCVKLANELEKNKVKVLRLTANNERLLNQVRSQDQEIERKSIWLKNCQCRGFSTASNTSSESSGKAKWSNVKVLPAEKEAPKDDQDILKNAVVLDAIKKARDEEKLKYTSVSNGPANEIACIYYKRELHKSNKKINSLTEEVKELKRAFKAYQAKADNRYPGLPLAETENTQITTVNRPRDIPKSSPPKAPRKQIYVKDLQNIPPPLEADYFNQGFLSNPYTSKPSTSADSVEKHDDPGDCKQQ